MAEQVLDVLQQDRVLQGSLTSLALIVVVGRKLRRLQIEIAKVAVLLIAPLTANGSTRCSRRSA